MFYSTSKAALALVVALLGWDGALPLPQEAGTAPTAVVEPAPAAPQEAPYLEIYSQGYSRFEIMDDEIVAHITGGVDFAYMGYAGHAEDLIYHHASQQAVASGDVQFSLGDVQLSSARAVLDVAAGLAELGEPVYGKLSSQGMLLEARKAKITFPAGQPPASLDDIQAELAGGVSVFTITGSWLTTEAVLLNGGERWLKTQGPFALSLSSEQLEQAQAQAGMQWGATRITGDQALLHYDEDGLLSQADVQALRIANDAGLLEAAAASVVRQGDAKAQQWEITLHGAPVSGHFAASGRLLDLSCDTLAGQLMPDGVMSAQLIGAVELSTTEQNFTGDQLDFTQAADGKWRVTISQGLALGFQLTDESLELGQLPLLGVE